MSIYRCALQVEAFNQYFVNVHHLEVYGTTPGDVATRWQTDCQTAYLACVSSAVELVDLTVVDIGTLSAYVLALTGTGTLVGDMCPPQVAGVISWRTTKVGRKYRGRTYMPGVPENHQSGGVPDATLVAAYGSYAAALRTVWPLPFSGNFVLYHKATNNTDVITSHIVREILYTQRRRTLGVGT